MRGIWGAACLLAASFRPSFSAAAPNDTVQTSRVILPVEFKPPAVFENVNLVRNVNLERAYPRETINVIIRNVGDKPESQYFVPFEASAIESIGGLEVHDKKDGSKEPFKTDIVEFDPLSSTQFYVVNLPQPLQPKAELTLSISYFVLSALKPLPAHIGQTDKQFLQHSFSAYFPSCYKTSKQKTKLKMPSANIAEYTKLPGNSAGGVESENKEDPQLQGTTLTYGPFSAVPAGVAQPVTVRYEYTHPLTHATLLERDIEVSHWGGNLATEERYWLVNKAAALKSQFSRVQWQQSAYYNPPTAALKGFTVSLQQGTTNAYFVDDIGNVSTSRFVAGTGSRPTTMDVRPRYPLFGDWKYKFKIGWDRDLRDSLRRSQAAKTQHILRVPFLEGPASAEGIEYEKVVLRVILPEGAIITSHETTIPATSITHTSTSTHRTFMDTKGRSVLSITALNLNDEFRDRDLFVVYEYSATAGLRKPVTIIIALCAVYVVAWVVARLDVRIQAPGAAKGKAKA